MPTSNGVVGATKGRLSRETDSSVGQGSLEITPPIDTCPQARLPVSDINARSRTKSAEGEEFISIQRETLGMTIMEGAKRMPK
jgi:hypothetical protein